ncbi:uncharacterized protein J3D65DRAFT_388919 [Phyllosticta citribraziliensis]|uniref:Uncharacterized protein n=1 Tax=Phyllosticta citribraziliensis TaxID=989973 RepID=A0ABR1LKS1_9PEZI
MHSFTTIALLATAALVSAASLPLDRRASVKTDVMLHAYGTGTAGTIGGTPLIYADGNALIGQHAPSNASVVSNVTFSFNGSSAPIGVSPTTSNTTAPTSMSMYINTGSDSFDSVSLSDSSPGDNYTDTGFVFFGDWLMWVGSDGTLQSKFHAAPTGEDGSWSLKWNSASEEDSTGIPVSLRSIAPSSDDLERKA